MNLFDHALDALLRRSQCQAGLARCSRVHSSEREAQEVELAFRDRADLCLVLVHCQLQLTHDFAQAMQRRFGVAPPAQDHEVIGIGDKASAKTLLKAELLPPQHEPAHVKVRQPWGAHLCLFYETKQDLLEMVVPYLKAGFES